MNQHSSANTSREDTEQEAERVRSRLMDNLDELKARGQSVGERAKNLEATLRRHPGLVVGVGAVSLVGLGLFLYARRARHLRDQRRDAILALAARLLGPAYVVERKEERPGMVGNTLKKASGALVAAAGRELGRRALLAVATRVADLEPEDHPASA